MDFIRQDIVDGLFGEDDTDNSTSPASHAISESVTSDLAFLTSTEVRHSLEGIGGGRGLFAVSNLPAGTLILAEAPLLSWTGIDLQEAEGLAHSVRMMLNSQIAHEICCNKLYPRIEDLTSEEIARISTQRLDGETIRSICSEFAVDECAVIHVLAILEHNGLTSGLYEHLSMINHSCIPNCIVFAPKPSSLGMAEVW
jgi:hypothetical protein